MGLRRRTAVLALSLGGVLIGAGLLAQLCRSSLQNTEKTQKTHQSARNALKPVPRDPLPEGEAPVGVTCCLALRRCASALQPT